MKHTLAPHALTRIVPCIHFTTRNIWTRIILGVSLAFLILLMTIRSAPVTHGQSSCQVDCTANVPASATTGTSVSFAAFATSSGCTSSANYEWDFGDGSSRATGANVTHSFNAPGVYNWTMTARADNGLTAIETIAGGYGEQVLVNQSPLTTPTAITRDPLGRGLYVYDQTAGSGLLRFINTSLSPVTLAGKIIAAGSSRVLADGSTFIGSTNALAVRADGNILFTGGDLLYALNVSANPQTVLGQTLSPGQELLLTPDAISPTRSIYGIAVHPQTGEIYFSSRNSVLKMTAFNQYVIAAGNGASTKPTDVFPTNPTTATNVPLLVVRDLAFDNAGNLFICDSGHGRVVKLDVNGQLSLTAQFSITPLNSFPAGLAVISDSVYVANGNNQTIWRLTGAGVTQPQLVSGTSGIGCTYQLNNCGDGGTVGSATYALAMQSSLNPFLGMDADADGLFVLDQSNESRGRIRYLNFSAQAKTLAGTSVEANSIATIMGIGLKSPFDGALATASALSDLSGVTLDANGNLWIADTFRHTIRFVNRGLTPVTLFAGTAAEQTVLPGRITTINRNVPPNATDNVTVNRATFDTPQGLFATTQGIFVADSHGGPRYFPPGTQGQSENIRTGLLRFINTSQATVTLFPGSATPIGVPPGFVRTIAGGSTTPGSIGNGNFALNARFIAPSDIVIHPTTGDIYLADAFNRAVRKINGSTGIVSGLNLADSTFTGLGMDANGRLYIADWGPTSLFSSGGRILRETTSGSGIFTQMNTTSVTRPRDVAVDATGNAYVTQSDSQSSLSPKRVLRISADGSVTTIAGSDFGFTGDGGPAINAQLMLTPPSTLVALSSGSNFPVLTNYAMATANIVLGANGELIFTDSLARRVRRIGAVATTCTKTGTIVVTGNYPQPVLTQLSPNSAFITQPFTLTITGSGFSSASVAQWNGSPRTTTFLSDTQLMVSIPVGDLTTVGSAAITVMNPAPGGGTSNSLPLSINAVLEPALTELIPNTVVRGGAGFRLQVVGENFQPNSLIRWNNQNLTTTYVDAMSLQADIPASEIQIAGTVAISVFTPSAGIQVTNSRLLDIVCSPVTLLPANLPTAFAGQPYNQPVSVQGINQPVFESGPVAPGLTISSSGIISGVPTATGTFTFRVRLTGQFNCQFEQSYSLTVVCPTFNIVPASQILPSTKIGLPYSQVFTVSPPSLPISFSVVSGTLPHGITLAPNGTLSGTATASGQFSFQVQAMLANGCIQQAQYAIEVTCQPLSLLPSSTVLPQAAIQSFYSQSFSINGIPSVPGSAIYSISAGTLPSSMFLATNGVLSGFPISAGTFIFTVRASFPGPCVAEQQYSLTVDYSPLAIDVSDQLKAVKGVFYEKGLGIRGGLSPYQVSLLPPVPGLNVQDINFEFPQLLGVPTTAGNFITRILVKDAAGHQAEKQISLQVEEVTTRILGNNNCPTNSDVLTIETEIPSRNSAPFRPIVFTLTPNANFSVVPGSCVSPTGSCVINGGSSLVWTGEIPLEQHATIRYQVRILATPPLKEICIAGEADYGSYGFPDILSNKIPTAVCMFLYCPNIGPGLRLSTGTAVDDQRPGSILVYNSYTSGSTSGNTQNTRLSLTNIHTLSPAKVHLFFVDGASCSVADSFVCLTPNQTTSFLASDFDPGTTGYLIAVAVDSIGCPANFNYLIGDEFVKFATGHSANLSAQTFAALPGGSVSCDTTTVIAQLNFDGVSYSQVSRTLAASNINSRADGNDTMLILNRIGGNLGTGMDSLGSLFGIFYNDAETSLSFSLTGGCQLRGSLSNNFPRITPRFEQFIPAGRTGWLKLYSQPPTDIGITGAVINFNPNASTNIGAFNQGHNLQALTLSNTNSLIIPVFPPSC